MSPIYLLPLGAADRTTVADLCPLVEQSFGTVASVREARIPLGQFLDERRLQYNSTAIINHLNERFASLVGPDESGATPRVLAVLEEDLFIPILTYVFGEAQLDGRVAVVSYHRLQSERYGLPRDPALLFHRLTKEALHELGHVFGLVHCVAQPCVMHISTYVEDIDFKTAEFCPNCRQQLLSLKR